MRMGRDESLLKEVHNRMAPTKASHEASTADDKDDDEPQVQERVDEGTQAGAADEDGDPAGDESPEAEDGPGRDRTTFSST